MINKSNKGFTLIEVLIYTAILSISGSLLSGVLFNTTKIKSRQTAVIEVNEQLGFVLQNIQRSIMDSSIIDIDAGTSTSTLVLKFKDDAKNPTKFYITDNIVYKKEATNTAQPLTDSSVIADAVNFLKVSGYSGHDSVQIDLTLSYNTSNPTSAFSRTLSSAVARVSAATFDSNLIPGTTSFYDIGTTALPWNNAYINGLVGIGNTAPLSKLGVTGSASVGATYGVIAAPTSGMIIEGNTGIASSTPWGLLSVNPNGITGPAFVVGSSTATKFIVDNGGNVGIGTTNPGQKLHIKGNLQVEDLSTTGSMYLVSSGGYSKIQDQNDVRLVIHQSTGNVGIGITNPGYKLEVNGAIGLKLDSVQPTISIDNISAGASLGSAIYYKKGGVAKWGIGVDIAQNNGTNNLQFYDFTNDLQRMVIASSGNVGIGTTAPDARLTIQGADTAAGGLDIRNNAGSNIGAIYGDGGNLYMQGYRYSTDKLYLGTIGSTQTITLSAGNVGIASTTPWGLLSVNPNGITGPAFVVGSSTATKFIVDNGGNIGIGTTAPKDQFVVSGTSGYSFNINNNDQANDVLMFQNAYYSSGYVDGTLQMKWNKTHSDGVNSYGSRGIALHYMQGGGIVFYADSVATTADTAFTPTERMRITNSGNVGIGTTAPGTHALSVVGTAGLSTGTAWTSTSDQRWKNIYSELKGESLNKIMALRPVSYKWNTLHDSQFGANPGLKYGFIAQEVKKVIPEMISQDAEGYYWYNPSGMEAILTGAIQEQQKQIEELKAEISELKNK
ncbi:MAG: tail fiber domain-containing protein [Patescibacteria group bacterium]